MSQAGSAMSLFTVTVTCQSNELYTAAHLSHAMHYSPLTAAVRHTPVSRQFRWQPRDEHCHECGCFSSGCAFQQRSLDLQHNSHGKKMLALTPPTLLKWTVSANSQVHLLFSALLEWLCTSEFNIIFISLVLKLFAKLHLSQLSSDWLTLVTERFEAWACESQVAILVFNLSISHRNSVKGFL